jgi:hypothetical protein
VGRRVGILSASADPSRYLPAAVSLSIEMKTTNIPTKSGIDNTDSKCRVDGAMSEP